MRHWWRLPPTRCTPTAADVGGNNVPVNGGTYNPDGLTVADVLSTAGTAPAAAVAAAPAAATCCCDGGGTCRDSRGRTGRTKCGRRSRRH